MRSDGKFRDAMEPQIVYGIGQAGWTIIVLSCFFVCRISLFARYTELRRKIFCKFFWILAIW